MCYGSTNVEMANKRFVRSFTHKRFKRFDCQSIAIYHLKSIKSASVPWMLTNVCRSIAIDRSEYDRQDSPPLGSIRFQRERRVCAPSVYTYIHTQCVCRRHITDITNEQWQMVKQNCELHFVTRFIIIYVWFARMNRLPLFYFSAAIGTRNDARNKYCDRKKKWKLLDCHFWTLYIYSFNTILQFEGAYAYVWCCRPSYTCFLCVISITLIKPYIYFYKLQTTFIV